MKRIRPFLPTDMERQVRSSLQYTITVVTAQASMQNAARSSNRSIGSVLAITEIQMIAVRKYIE